MVYVNGLKYACEACIKGHRSSSCSHRQRPLFEIKKKGRPVSQCEHCRQLRKIKQVHVKCNCEGGTEDVRTDVRGKANRKMPASAAFPEGLSEMSSSPSPSAPQKNSQASASNCGCKSSGHCSCATPIIKKSDRFQVRDTSSDAYSPPVTPPSLTPVSSCCSGKNKPIYGSHPQVQSDIDVNPYSPSLINDFAHPTPHPITPTSHGTNDIYYGFAATLATDFSWPSSSGVGRCSCGALCACPGCYEHSDPSTVLMSSENCPYACTTCSDCNGFGFAPPVSHQVAGAFTDSNPPPFTAWPHSPAVLSSAPASLSHTSSSTSDCCGGSCKCSRQSLSCQCTSACCGCCSGCSCSESESEAAGAGAEQEDTRERLGFAVSGERGNCCSETEGRGHDRANKDNKEGGSRPRKRRRVEGTHDKDSEGRLITNPIRDPPALIQASLSDGPTLNASGIDSSGNLEHTQ